MIHEQKNTTKTQEKQDILTKEMLYRRGYTISAAARLTGISAGHLNQVLNGKRKSSNLMRKIQSLPPRPLVLREKK